MTGRYARFGQAMREAALLATGTDEARQVGGRRIRLVIEDDACDRARAIEVAQRLVASKAVLVVGHHCPGASLAAAPIYAAAGIVMISPGTTEPAFTDKRAGPSIFRLAPRDDMEGAVSGAWLARNFSGRRVAILHDRTLAGIALAEATRKSMRAGGLAEALHSGFVAGEPDYLQVARDLRSRQIDAVYLGAYPSEVTLILAALARDGQRTQVVASHLLAAATETGGSQQRRRLDGLAVTAPADIGRLADPASLPPDSPGFAERRTKSNTLAAFEAWGAAAAGDPSPAAATHELQTSTMRTVLGDIRFDKKGDAMVPFFAMYVWRGDMLRPAPEGAISAPGSRP